MMKRIGALVLLMAAAQASALTLGPVEGKVVIGRPLDLVVKAVADGAEPGTGQCQQAEVGFGDNRLSDADVTAISLPSPAAGWRIRTRTAVNEPLVSLVLRVGCQVSFSRSYVLLADQDDALARPAARVRQERLVQPARKDIDYGLAPAPVQLPKARPRPPGVERLPAKTRPNPVASSTQRPAPTRAEPPAVKSSVPQRLGPRLELELLEHGLGAASAAAANGNPGPVPAATAAPVAASQPQPSAGQASGSGGPQLGRELEALRAEQARTREVVEALRAQLAQSRPPRWQDPVVLALLGLCIASLLALAWTLLRSRRQRWA